MAVVIVVGAQWGDEGKGKVVDLLTERARYVVRWAGGANAGHTLVVDGKKYVTRLIPSGVLRADVTCVLGEAMVVDPTVLVDEVRAFRAQGFESELQWQPTAHLFARGGYTYLDAVVEQSFSSSAVAASAGYAPTNPSYPDIPIGSSPFVGARPFRRPPHTGFFLVQYTRPRFTAAAIRWHSWRASDRRGSSPGHVRG